MHQRVGAHVAIKTRFKSFGENFVELQLQGVNVRNAGRAWRHPLGLLFFEFEKIEIETAVRDFLGARKSLFRNGEERETRRQCQRFLLAGEHEVDTEGIYLDLDSGE